LGFFTAFFFAKNVFKVTAVTAQTYAETVTSITDSIQQLCVYDQDKDSTTPDTEF